MPQTKSKVDMSKKWIIILSVVAVLVAIRLALPGIVKKYVNKTLDEMEGYSGQVEDIDIRLIRGAYVIKELELVQTGDSIPIPFLDIERIDLSVHWGALLKGRVVGEVVMDRPIVNFASAEDESGETVSQDGSEADWTETLDDLIPIQVNRFEINNGKISFKDFSSEPQVDVFIDNLNLLATNLSTVQDKSKKLPANLKATGTSLGGGQLNIVADLNLLKEIPDLDLDLKFEGVDVTALNNFAQAYANIDVERGTFNLYTEIAVDNAELSGYVKPIFEDLKIIDWKKEEEGFLHKIWETVVAGVVTIFENQPKDQFATKVPLSGNLNDLEAETWPSIWNIVKNAFIEAFSKDLEGTVDINTPTEGEEKTKSVEKKK